MARNLDYLLVGHMKLKEVHKGDLFTKKDIQDPKESQVWIRGEYCREEGKYIITRWSDMNDFQLMDGNKTVYTGFTF